MIAALGTLVDVESPSSDPAACAACVDVTDGLGADLLGEKAERVQVEDNVHLRWRFGPTKVVLLGHVDTVWPLGTLDEWPFEVEGDRATGPGTFDMKGGVVQLLFALACLEDLDGVGIVLTTDEEIGSPTSLGLIEETVTGAGAVLVLEPSADGALKTARKGVSSYRVDITGRAAHAGLDPEKGINAVIELSHQIQTIADFADPGAGTTVTPSVVTGGTAINTVPGRARLEVDVRTSTIAEQERVDAAFGSLGPVNPDAKVSAQRRYTARPMERRMSEDLLAQAREVARDLGLPGLAEAEVGGGSDGNFTAGLGIPTLDGLGAVGGNAHAEGEWLSIPAMVERAALVAGLVQRLK
jgi:glutamate carboxypeptidase